MHSISGINTASSLPAVYVAIIPIGCALETIRFFLPEGVLSEVFRGKFLAALQQAHASGQLQFHGLPGGLTQLKLSEFDPSALRAAMGGLPQPFGGPDQAGDLLAPHEWKRLAGNSPVIDGELTI